MINKLLFLNLGSGEVLLVMFFVLLFFGSKNLPQLARGLGRGMREMRDAMNSVQREIEREANKIEEDTKKQVDDIKDHAKLPPTD